MDEEPSVTITLSAFSKWVLLGLPAIVLWGISGAGASSLTKGLRDGSIVTGTPGGLGMMWTFISILSLAGIVFGMSALFRPIQIRYLGLNVLVAFMSLFFSVLT